MPVCFLHKHSGLKYYLQCEWFLGGLLFLRVEVITFWMHFLSILCLYLLTAPLQSGSANCWHVSSYAFLWHQVRDCDVLFVWVVLLFFILLLPIYVCSSSLFFCDHFEVFLRLQANFFDIVLAFFLNSKQRDFSILLRFICYCITVSVLQGGGETQCKEVVVWSIWVELEKKILRWNLV